MNILLIEDDNMLRKALSYHLLNSSYTLSAAQNGKDALAILEQNKDIDVLICDLLMPEISGPTFILMLKKFFPKKLPVIIIITHVKEGESFLKKIDVKYDYFLAKPVDFDQLDKILRSIQGIA